MLQPIWMNTLQPRVWNFIRKKIVTKTDSDIHRKTFFKKISPFILDIVNSQSVRQCNFYNHKKIFTLTGNLQKENYEESVVNELDWWLSFELFRQQSEQSKGF